MKLLILQAFGSGFGAEIRVWHAVPFQVNHSLSKPNVVLTCTRYTDIFSGELIVWSPSLTLAALRVKLQGAQKHGKYVVSERLR